MPDESIRTALAGASPEPPQGTLQSATAWASVAGGLAAWLAAGSTGFLAGSLGSTLAGLCLLLATVAVWPSATRRWPLGLTVAGALGCLTWFPANNVQHVLLVAAVLAALALGQEATDRTVLRITAGAALALGLFRLTCSSVPVVWLWADTVGGWLGRCAALWTGAPLVIGASFGGLDFLVWSLAFALGALVHADGPRGPRACWLIAGILAAHLLYLTLLALAADVLDALPIPPTPEFPHPYVPPPWSWARAVRSTVPWNLPLVGATLQLLVQALLLRWWTWPTRSEAPETRHLRAGWAGTKPGWRWTIQAAPYVLAVAVPISATLVLGRQDLAGQRILANLQGQLDWTQPQHGRYGRASAGRYGMLPLLVESLGGHLTKTAEFRAEELAQADIVLLLNPAGPVAAEQRACLEDFVRRGGALLVVGGPLLRQEGQTGSHNDWLFAQDLQVRQDVALSLTGHWQQSLQPLAHPANAMSWGRCTWCSDSGASLAVGPAAQPLVVGRWGWSDPGSDAVLTNVYRWEAGERLGDLVLAAEQRLGQGTVVVLGDGTALTNEGLVRGYNWTGRLLSHLAHRGSSPQVGWRQSLSLLLLAALFATLGWRPSAAQVLGVALLAVASQAACAAVGREATQVIPDGRLLTAQPDRPPYRLAYVAASHAEAYSDGDWGFDAINGLTLNLMRNGYLTLALPELTRARLAGTAVVVSIGPAKRFTADERRWLQEFVRDGGLWICTVGAEEAAASADLLADFGCRVPASPVPTAGDWREPEPLGHFRSLFLDAKDYGQGDYKVAVLFHTGWPVECDATDAEVFVRGPHEEPVVVSRPLGQGRIVLIGDTNFALNKNLEYVGGEPFEGRHENADFWRWLLSRATDRPEWIPPEPPPLVPSDETAAQEEAQP